MEGFRVQICLDLFRYLDICLDICLDILPVEFLLE